MKVEQLNTPKQQGFFGHGGAILWGALEQLVQAGVELELSYILSGVEPSEKFVSKYAWNNFFFSTR